MSFKVLVDGVEVLCDTAQDAIALATGVANTRHPVPRVEKPQAPVNNTPKINALPTKKVEQADFFDPTDHKALTKSGLNALAHYGRQEIPSEILQRALRVNHPKGLGSRISRVNQVIKGLGFDPKTVFYARKTPTGRLFRIGRNFKECYQRVQEL